MQDTKIDGPPGPSKKGALAAGHSYGRDAMILIAGCNGHVGSRIMSKAAAAGVRARCFDLSPPAVPPEAADTLDVMTGDITDPADVQRALDGVAAVMFVVGLKRTKKGLTHEAVELSGMRNVLAAGRKTGLQHVLYTSALGVDAGVPATSLIAKHKAEQEIISSGIAYTIFRPSGYFVDFAEHFAPKIRQTGSFTLIGSGETRVQPLDPADLAEAFLQSLGNDRVRNRIFRIAGPEVFTLNEVVELVGRVVGREVRIKHLPVGLMHAVFSLMALITGSRGAKDFLYRMSRDSVCSEEDRREVQEAFSIEFKRLEPWLKEQPAVQ